MNQNPMSIKRALISVSDKTGLIEFAKGLHALNIEILSTGGTSRLLREANLPVRDVSDVTGFPEMMDGRLKTLHPKIHGGILGLRDQHATVAMEHDIPWIDLVVVNLYPFAATIKNSDVSLDEAIENMDIGGPTMIRAAAKNMGWTAVIVQPQDYDSTLAELQQNNTLSFATRKQLATKAFAHTAQYDATIATYLDPELLTLTMKKHIDLRYGENPHQAAVAYRFAQQTSGILLAKQHQGKPLSFNNLTDADAAYACVNEFSQPACVIVKHANPCGVSVADRIADAFVQAIAADSTSAFGGIVALNRICDEETAKQITDIFMEVVIAPGYTEQALLLLAKKPNLRILELPLNQGVSHQEYKFIEGGMLVQDKDSHILGQDQLKIVTQCQPKPEDLVTMQFAWQVLKHIKSNAILIAKNNQTVGVGAGQVSRVDAVDIALKKAGENVSGAILASDAFFPFRDSIDHLANTGVTAIIQPGGSIRDEEVIAACDEHGIAMVMTGIRCFKH